MHQPSPRKSASIPAPAILAGLALAWLASAVQATADDRISRMAALNTWYAAVAGLSAAPGDAIESVADADAQIVLEDIGITQTRAEFIESLDMVHDALDGGALAWRPDTQASASDGATQSDISALVCYRFADNESLTRETFTFEAGLIVSSVQVAVAEDCSQF